MYWVVVHAWPAREEQVAARLRGRLGLMVSYPFVVEISLDKRGRRLERRRPFFPRYMFAWINDRLVSAVNEVYEVSGVVSVAGCPVVVPDGVIGPIRALQDEEGCVERRDLTRPWSRFRGRPGDQVRISSANHALSALDGLAAVLSSVERLREHGEVGLFIEMLGSQREVSVPAEVVELV